MLIINGLRFALNDAEFATAGAEPTFAGYAQRNGTGLLLLDATKTPRVQVVNNRHGEVFFVSAVRQADGRLRYMFALSTADEKWLGLTSYWAECECAVKALRDFNEANKPRVTEVEPA